MVGVVYQRIVQAIADELADLFFAEQAVFNEHSIETGKGLSLDNFGHQLLLERIAGESDDTYRTLLKNVATINASAGTRDAIIAFLSNFLRIEESQFNIIEENPLFVTIKLPADFQGQEDDLKRNLLSILAAGVHVNFIFTETYWDQAVWDDNTEPLDLWV